jgi:hypothetical protein
MENTTTIHDAAEGGVSHEHDPEHEGEHEHEPHMPPPSLSPIILAAGITALAFGVIFGWVLIVIGVVVMLIGLGTWLYDEIKNATAPA